MGILMILVFIAVNVLLHEFAHAIEMERNGIRIKEFGLGFPPRLKAFRIGHKRILTLNFIPLGGFVKPANEKAMDELSYYPKAQILGAGVIANLILGGILYGILALIVGAPIWFFFVGFGGAFFLFLIRKYISLALPFLGFGVLGFIIWSLINSGVSGTVVGPVGIVSISATLQSFTFMLFLGYALSIGIGLVNMLPIGPLDGGQALIALLRKFFGKREKLEKAILKGGFVLLILLFVVLTMYELGKVYVWEPPLPQ